MTRKNRLGTKSSAKNKTENTMKASYHQRSPKHLIKKTHPRAQKPSKPQTPSRHERLRIMGFNIEIVFFTKKQQALVDIEVFSSLFDPKSPGSFLLGSSLRPLSAGLPLRWGSPKPSAYFEELRMQQLSKVFDNKVSQREQRRVGRQKAFFFFLKWGGGLFGFGFLWVSYSFIFVCRCLDWCFSFFLKLLFAVCFSFFKSLFEIFDGVLGIQLTGFRSKTGCQVRLYITFEAIRERRSREATPRSCQLWHIKSITLEVKNLCI